MENLWSCRSRRGNFNPIIREMITTGPGKLITNAGNDLAVGMAVVLYNEPDTSAKGTVAELDPVRGFVWVQWPSGDQRQHRPNEIRPVFIPPSVPREPSVFMAQRRARFGRSVPAFPMIVRRVAASARQGVMRTTISQGRG